MIFTFKTEAKEFAITYKMTEYALHIENNPAFKFRQQNNSVLVDGDRYTVLKREREKKSTIQQIRTYSHTNNTSAHFV